MRDKSQFFSVDMIFAALIFIAILIAAYSYLEYSFEKINSAETRDDLELISRNAFSALLTTDGSPSNWSKINAADFNESNVKSLGLAKSPGINNNLDSDKIDRLKELNATKYSTLKNILGVIGNYEFELSISNWNGTAYKLNSKIGIAGNSTNVVNLNRYASLNTTWLFINFKTWER